MKKLSKLIIITGIITSVSFISCKKEEDSGCKAIVTVKQKNDTTVVVPNARVTIANGDVHVEGLADANGQFQSTFKLEAVLNVVAQLKNSSDTLFGQAFIRLRPGETVCKSIFVR